MALLGLLGAHDWRSREQTLDALRRFCRALFGVERGYRAHRQAIVVDWVVPFLRDRVCGVGISHPTHALGASASGVRRGIYGVWGRGAGSGMR